MGTMTNGLFAQVFVILKILSSKYQLYVCGKIFRVLDFERKSSFFKAPSVTLLLTSCSPGPHLLQS